MVPPLLLDVHPGHKVAHPRPFTLAPSPATQHTPLRALVPCPRTCRPLTARIMIGGSDDRSWTCVRRPAPRRRSSLR